MLASKPTNKRQSINDLKEWQKMRWKTVLTVMIISSQLNAAELEIPKVFINGEVANANDFNLNSNYLVENLKEDRTKIEALEANARWKNSDESGVVNIEVDCTTNQSALVEAYQSNPSVDHIGFIITGSCFGSIASVQEVGDEGQPVLGQIQPKNQVVYIKPNLETDPTNRAKIVPRKLTDQNGDNFVSGMFSSFGNGLYLTNLDIEMGADDSYAVLYSRSSNGGLSNVTITGPAEPNNLYQRGVVVQNGASAYIDSSSITGVDRGVSMLGESFVYLINATIIAQNGVRTFNGGTFSSLVSDITSTDGTAISMNQGGQGYIVAGSIQGAVALDKSSLYWRSPVPTNVSMIELRSAHLTVLNADQGFTEGLFKCYGLSSVNVNGLSLRNNNGNGCLDDEGWGSIISGQFPISGTPKDAEVPVSKRMPEALDTEELPLLEDMPTLRASGRLVW
jgi:hypothetical protein